MIRAFAAIALPEPVRFDLMIVQSGLPVPRAVPLESLHLTLVFLGELPEPVVADADAAFTQVRAGGFTLEPRGIGIFGGAKPRLAYAGVAESPALRHLQAKVETAARNAGVSIPARRFHPHVTLARLPERGVDRQRLEVFVASRAGYSGPGFAVDDFRLYRSHLTSAGPVYEELARYPLD